MQKKTRQIALANFRRQIEVAKDEALVELVRQGAVSKLWRVARAMETQMNKVGEETVLGNHLFRSMGYRLNQWPMHHLSKYVSRLTQ